VIDKRLQDVFRSRPEPVIGAHAQSGVGDSEGDECRVEGLSYCVVTVKRFVTTTNATDQLYGYRQATTNLVRFRDSGIDKTGVKSKEKYRPHCQHTGLFKSFCNHFRVWHDIWTIFNQRKSRTIRGCWMEYSEEFSDGKTMAKHTVLTYRFFIGSLQKCIPGQVRIARDRSIFGFPLSLCQSLEWQTKWEDQRQNVFIWVQKCLT
jgi:hypothetical protein